MARCSPVSISSDKPWTLFISKMVHVIAKIVENRPLRISLGARLHFFWRVWRSLVVREFHLRYRVFSAKNESSDQVKSNNTRGSRNLTVYMMTRHNEHLTPFWDALLHWKNSFFHRIQACDGLKNFLHDTHFAFASSPDASCRYTAKGRGSKSTQVILHFAEIVEDGTQNNFDPIYTIERMRPRKTKCRRSWRDANRSNTRTESARESQGAQCNHRLSNGEPQMRRADSLTAVTPRVVWRKRPWFMLRHRNNVLEIILRIKSGSVRLTSCMAPTPWGGECRILL